MVEPEQVHGCVISHFDFSLLIPNQILCLKKMLPTEFSAMLYPRLTLLC